MARFDRPIQAIRGPVDAAIGLLETMPGVARPTADMIVAAIGPEMRRVPSADHGASWAGVAPGHDERAGTRPAGTTRQGPRFWRTGLVHAAHAAARTTGTARRAPYRRLATRRGKKRAILAVAHAILVMASERIQRRDPYREAGGDGCDRLQPEDTARRLVKRIESLGYQVTLRSPSTDARPSRRPFCARQLSRPGGAPRGMHRGAHAPARQPRGVEGGARGWSRGR
jgi:transposase